MRSYLSDYLPILSARWRFKTWVPTCPLHICFKNFWTVIAHSLKARNQIDMILNPSMGAWLFILLAKAFFTFLNIPPDSKIDQIDKCRIFMSYASYDIKCHIMTYDAYDIEISHESIWSILVSKRPSGPQQSQIFIRFCITNCFKLIFF
jgi:hypothetical protein